MKIAVDITPMKVDGSVGGVMNVIIGVIEGLRKRDNIQLVLLCAYWNKEFLHKYVSKNVTLIEVIKESSSDNRLAHFIQRVRNKLLQCNKINAILSENKVDILFCPFSAETYKEAGIPVVSTINDIQHEYYPQFFTPEEYNHRKQFYNDISRKAEGIICISDYTKKTFCEKYNYDEKRAYTIYIAVQNRFKNEDPAVLDKLYLKDSRYIVFPANFWEHKNHKILLNAFSMYAQKDKDAKLVLTGNTLGKEKEFLDIIDKMGLKDRVIITGYLNNDEFYSILKNSKGLIFPSLFEGFGIPVVEAMYINKLVACSNVTSLPEIGCDSICYFNPVKPDEVLKGIEYLFENEITDEIIADYKKQLEKYDFDKMIDHYIEVFQKVINNKSEMIFSDLCDGIYPDKWSSSCIQLQCADKRNSTLEMKISLPGFLKSPLKFTTLVNSVEKSYSVKPGQTMDLKWDVTSDKWSLLLSVKKTWTPAETLKSEDNRELGFMVNDLTLITENKDKIKLV